MKPARPGQLVLVHWLDAHADSGWGPALEVKNRAELVVSIGWVIAHDHQALTIVADCEKRKPHKGQVNRTLTIPAGMVEKIWEVRL